MSIILSEAVEPVHDRVLFTVKHGGDSAASIQDCRGVCMDIAGDAKDISPD
ncbi:hypothetical protein [Paenarthrobacter nicotinovorans]|uniref:hypothetical protein n=1 Tax=Paenarthrobacter nicotinovorans TaxID=29320 RepID=UPI001643443A|nr:hypothetical protein [Paenarthrobacter nicotinovorans]